MSALMWWLIPLVATAVAIVWTSVLARRERRRSDDQWRAKKLAAVGQRLMDTDLPSPAGRDLPTPAVGRPPENNSG